MALEWKKLKISLAFNHNGEVLFSFEFVLGEICVGLPYFPKIGVCGHLYHIDFVRTPLVFLRACLTVKLKLFVSPLEIRFHCLDANQTKGGPLLEQVWTLSHYDQIVPEESSMVAVLIKKDQVAIEFNSPVPAEVIEQIGTFLEASVEVIHERAIIIKDAAVEATKNFVCSAATNARNWSKSLFG